MYNFNICWNIKRADVDKYLASLIDNPRLLLNLSEAELYGTFRLFVEIYANKMIKTNSYATNMIKIMTSIDYEDRTSGVFDRVYHYMLFNGVFTSSINKRKKGVFGPGAWCLAREWAFYTHKMFLSHVRLHGDIDIPVSIDAHNTTDKDMLEGYRQVYMRFKF